MLVEDKDFKLDVSKIPKNAYIEYGCGEDYYLNRPIDLSKKMKRYEDRIAEIDKQIETLNMERESEILMARTEMTRAEGIYPRVNGYEMFVRGREHQVYDEKYYFYLADKLDKLLNSEASREDIGEAKIYLENFILLFFCGGGTIDVGYAIDFIKAGSYQSSFDDPYPPSSNYTFMTSFPNVKTNAIENKEVTFCFYDPWLLNSWDRKHTILKQWQNANLGKILVSITDLVKNTSSGTHDNGIPQQFTEWTGYKRNEPIAFRSFNPFEIAAWLQLKIMGLKENKFVARGEQRISEEWRSTSIDTIINRIVDSTLTEFLSGK